MAIRKIVIIGDDILRKRSKEVTVFDERLTELLGDMKESMNEAIGVGLAAVQVGVLKRVFIIDCGKGLTEFINPVIISSSGINKSLKEGCLSVPGQEGCVLRPNKLKIRAQNRKGEFFEKTFIGFEAKAVSHEYDHLEGILYTDKLMTEEQVNEIRKKFEEQKAEQIKKRREPKEKQPDEVKDKPVKDIKKRFKD